MAPVKKPNKNKSPSGKNSPTVKASNQKMKSNKKPDKGVNVGDPTKPSRSSLESNSENMFFDESLSGEGGSSLHLSPPKVFDSSSSGRKLSLRKISLEVSSSLPIENESEEEEEEEETKKTEKVNDTPTISMVDPTATTIGESLISSTVKSMTMEQMQEHISCCLQLNTENKINTKNAFALKLIDCMTLMIKNQDESNFAAMACQLDAGTKIYSHRVDAVHQQVMKLAESCAYAERKDKKKQDGQNEDDEQDDNLNEKERRIKAKKKILAPREQITRKLKGKDPRDNFVQLEAKPGSIFNRARRDPRDLSLTLEKHIPFWRDFSKPGLRVGGTVPYPCYGELAKMRERYKQVLEKEGRWNPPESSAYETPQAPEVDYENPRPSTSAEDDYGHFEDAPEEEVCGDEPASELPNKVEERVANAVERLPAELQILSLAENKMSMQMTGRPSKFDVLKSLFYKEGESEYNYLKMDNVSFWTGTTHWKRPQNQNANAAAFKKKGPRKKKDPLEIKYGKEAEAMSTKMTLDIAPSKRTTHLTRRTMTNWKMKKVTYPPDIHFHPQMFYRLFNIEVKALFRDEDKENPATDEVDDVPNFDIGREGDDYADDNASTMSEDNESLPEEIVSDAPAENCEFEDNSTPAESYTEAVQNQKKEQTAGALSKPSTSDGVYEGDNLVPMVKIVQVEPIRCVAKPNRVDFQHLKNVMLEVIQEKMQDKENHPATDAGETPSVVAFKDVLYELFNSDRLHYRTKEDLSVAMAFLCLLTLTNENCFSLNQEGNTGTEDVLISYATNEHLNRQFSYQ